MPTIPPTCISTRNATAYVDPDSKEELETDLNVFFDGDTGKAHQVLHAVPVQNLPQGANLCAAPSVPPAVNQSLSEEPIQSESPNILKADRKQGASVMIGVFAPHLDNIQDAILKTKYHPDLISKLAP
ncbi:hypothetical protein EST38_g14671 [Candolleomyces aberdarensis]|uniref:Uncharacterized protein n=1 Tax=Candolleomyces aberdarensis TaxID=2316362 RepID=A0A4Q2CZ30_9AGAR|nr:hypothetical protein EST38_g14671 [Candolleomyces aberdarensis]